MFFAEVKTKCFCESIALGLAYANEMWCHPRQCGGRELSAADAMLLNRLDSVLVRERLNQLGLQCRSNWSTHDRSDYTFIRNVIANPDLLPVRDARPKIYSRWDKFIPKKLFQICSKLFSPQATQTHAVVKCHCSRKSSAKRLNHTGIKETDSTSEKKSCFSFVNHFMGGINFLRS